MEAVLWMGPGGPEDLIIGEAPVPSPGPGEALIEVEACGLNPVDVKTMRSGVEGWPVPHVGGLDAAGRIRALGDGVKGWVEGERVVFHGDLTREGGFAEFVVSPVDVLARIPDSVPTEVAAALPCAGMTAYQAIVRRLHLGPGDDVLVTAGAGGVGGFAIQLAKLAGARVLATASGAKTEIVRALGADEVIDYRNEDVHTRVLELTGGAGVDGIVDLVSAGSAAAGLSLLRHGGGLAAIADRPELWSVKAFGIAPSIHEIALGAAHGYDEKARRRLSEDLSALLVLVAEGRLDPRLERSVPLIEVPSALSEIARGHAVGKTVMLVD